MRIKTIGALLTACVFCVAATQRYQQRTKEVETMANQVWINGGDGDGSLAGSWSTGAVLANQDVVVFDGTSDVAWSSGLTISGFAIRLVVLKNNQAQIGQPGSPLFGSSINVLTGDVIRGKADVYLAYSLRSQPVIVDMNGGTLYIGTDVNVTVLASVFIKGGRVILGPQWGASDPTSKGLSVYLYGPTANVTIDESSRPLPAFMIVNDGFLENKRDFTSDQQILNVSGGECLQKGIINANMLVRVGPGGVLRYAPSSDPTGEAAYFYVDGILDISESKFSIPFNGLYVGPGGQVIGSAINREKDIITYDLRQELP